MRDFERSVDGTAGVKNRFVLLNPLARAPTYYILLNARQKYLMLSLDGDDYLGCCGAKETP
jgi:hypothetical protein